MHAASLAGLACKPSIAIAIAQQFSPRLHAQRVLDLQMGGRIDLEMRGHDSATRYHLRPMGARHRPHRDEHEREVSIGSCDARSLLLRIRTIGNDWVLPYVTDSHLSSICSLDCGVIPCCNDLSDCPIPVTPVRYSIRDSDKEAYKSALKGRYVHLPSDRN